MNKLANPKINDGLRVRTNTRSIEFISNVINLAAHYRMFFTKSKIHSKIYLYLQYPFKTTKMKNKMLNPQYRDNYEFRYRKNPNNFPLSQVIEESVPLIKLITEYIEGVYFVQSGNIENSVTPYVITSETSTVDANFIVSTSQYDLQSVIYGFDIIIPNRDKSTIVTAENAIQKIKEGTEVQSDSQLSAEFIPFILSVIGDKNRNIDRVKGIGVKKVFRCLDSALDRKLITPQTTNINLLVNALSDKFKSMVLSNFYCTDIATQYAILNKPDIYRIIEQLIDKFDNASLKKMNDMYFSEFPIQLVEITSKVHTRQEIQF